MADPDPITCDPGSWVYDPNPGTVIPDPIYLVTTLSKTIPFSMNNQCCLWIIELHSYQAVQYNVGQTICYTLMSMHFLNIY